MLTTAHGPRHRLKPGCEAGPRRNWRVPPSDWIDTARGAFTDSNAQARGMFTIDELSMLQEGTIEIVVLRYVLSLASINRSGSAANQ